TSAAAAASASGTPAGVGYAHFASTQTSSAVVPCRPSSPWLDPHTRSPDLNAVTPGPSALTVPAKSAPGIIGAGGKGIFTVPARMYVSIGLSADAATRTRISPARGVGEGSSPYFNTSGGPGAS